MTGETRMDRRQLLAAAGVTTAGLMAGGASLAGIADAASGRTPLWEVAYRRGLIYGASISTWMYQDDAAYARLFKREAAMLWPEDDFLWYHLRPSPTSGLDFTSPDMIVGFAEKNRQLDHRRRLVWDEGFGDGWTDDDMWGIRARRGPRRAVLDGTAMVSRYPAACRAGSSATRSGTDHRGRRHGLRTDVPWYNTIGPGYVAEAYHQAHEQDPHALLLSERVRLRHRESVRRRGRCQASEATLEVLDNLLTTTSPCTASASRPTCSATDFKHRSPKLRPSFLKEISDRGLKIMITEMDVLDDGLPAAIKPRDIGIAGASTSGSSTPSCRTRT